MKSPFVLNIHDNDIICFPLYSQPGLAIRDYWSLGKEVCASIAFENWIVVSYIQKYIELTHCSSNFFCLLIIQDQKDDKYIVLVVDQFGGRGNVLNFNVGEGVKFALPNVFWTRLSGKYGTTFFVRENGIDISITNAVEAIVQCLRSEDAYCVNVPDQGVSMKSLGL